MSELIDNSQKRMGLLKHLILQLHKGEAPEQVKGQLARLLGTIPYGEVVKVEQELISEGLPQEEVLSLCDVHSAVLKGHIDQTGAKAAPAGHPVHTFQQENRALEKVIAGLLQAFEEAAKSAAPSSLLRSTHKGFTDLMDVEKHYRRKENLLFPLMEKHGITGPPQVMWGKHDQTRALLKGALEALAESENLGTEEARAVIELLLRPAAASVEEMIYKEEQILFPMCMDLLADTEWYDIMQQSPEIGFCLYDPQDKWIPEGQTESGRAEAQDGRVVLPSGSFTPRELAAMLNTLPMDITFVDGEDAVRYFSQGNERIFDRTRAILGRKVQHCHPPNSVHIVNKILDDFRSGRQDKAEFWITLHGQFIFISYYAVRDDEGKYLGTVEMTIDLTRLRKLEGEQRLLDYGDKQEAAQS